jgi:hypothetical protein
MIVVSVYFFIKKVVLHIGATEPNRKSIFSLEVCAIALIFGAFVFGELMHGFHDIHSLLQKHKETKMTDHPKESSMETTGLKYNDALLLLGSFLGSLAIYAAFVYYLKLNGNG